MPSTEKCMCCALHLLAFLGSSLPDSSCAPTRSWKRRDPRHKWMRLSFQPRWSLRIGHDMNQCIFFIEPMPQLAHGIKFAVAKPPALTRKHVRWKILGLKSRW